MSDAPIPGPSPSRADARGPSPLEGEGRVEPRTLGARKLRACLEFARDVDPLRVVALVGYDLLGRILYDDAVPTDELAIQIAELTQGAVDPVDWAVQIDAPGAVTFDAMAQDGPAHVFATGYASLITGPRPAPVPDSALELARLRFDTAVQGVADALVELRIASSRLDTALEERFQSCVPVGAPGGSSTGRCAERGGG